MKKKEKKNDLDAVGDYLQHYLDAFASLQMIETAAIAVFLIGMDRFPMREMGRERHKSLW